MDWLVIRAFLTMMMIVGLMFALLVVVRKYLFNRPNISNENMKVLSSLSLQPKKSIFLVKVFNKVMLVGISDNSIAALGEITDEETLEIIDATAQRKQMKSFSEILRGISLK